MTSKTPITPDVITIPRQLDDNILPNIIGLQRKALANALNDWHARQTNKNENRSNMAVVICKRCSKL